MPVAEAQYAVLLARAVPSLTPQQIEDEVPLAKGWAWIHASCLLHGEAMVWPDFSRTRAGRWLAAAEAHLAGRKKTAKIQTASNKMPPQPHTIGTSTRMASAARI